MVDHECPGIHLPPAAAEHEEVSGSEEQISSHCSSCQQLSVSFPTAPHWQTTTKNLSAIGSQLSLSHNFFSTLSQSFFYSLSLSLSLSLSIFFHKQKVVWKSAHQRQSKKQDLMKTNALWSLISTKSVACHNWKPESYQQVINCTLYSWSKNHAVWPWWWGI